MYLHLGKGKIIAKEDIVGIFDLDVTSQSHLTRKFLSMSEKAGRVENAAEDIPKSFVVCFSKDGTKLYLSQMSSATLLKRCEQNSI